MSKIRWATAALTAGLLAGCTTKHKDDAATMAPPPAPMVTLEQTRASFRSANPMAQVGVVSTVRADRSLLAVTDIPDQALTVDEPVSIVDSTSSYPLVCNGWVENISGNLVFVHYLPGSRLPRRRLRGAFADTPAWPARHAS